MIHVLLLAVKQHVSCLYNNYLHNVTNILCNLNLWQKCPQKCEVCYVKNWRKFSSKLLACFKFHLAFKVFHHYIPLYEIQYIWPIKWGFTVFGPHRQSSWITVWDISILTINTSTVLKAYKNTRIIHWRISTCSIFNASIKWMEMISGHLRF